jgi:predicted Abi (CAAX) family protease
MSGAWSASGAWGLVLFMRQGVAAWMHAWPQQVGDDPPATKPALPTVTLALPTSVSGQLVTVLANMVFTAKQEVFA